MSIRRRMTPRWRPPSATKSQGTSVSQSRGFARLWRFMRSSLAAPGGPWSLRPSPPLSYKLCSSSRASFQSSSRQSSFSGVASSSLYKRRRWRGRWRGAARCSTSTTPASSCCVTASCRLQPSRYRESSAATYGHAELQPPSPHPLRSDDSGWLGWGPRVRRVRRSMKPGLTRGTAHLGWWRPQAVCRRRQR